VHVGQAYMPCIRMYTESVHALAGGLEEMQALRRNNAARMGPMRVRNTVGHSRLA